MNMSSPVTTASTAIAGHLADKSNSRRATYMLGLIALAISTVMFSVGRSVAVLVVARSIQGASSAFVHCVGVVSEEPTEQSFPMSQAHPNFSVDAVRCCGRRWLRPSHGLRDFVDRSGDDSG